MLRKWVIALLFVMYKCPDIYAFYYMKFNRNNALTIMIMIAFYYIKQAIFQSAVIICIQWYFKTAWKRTLLQNGMTYFYIHKFVHKLDKYCKKLVLLHKSCKQVVWIRFKRNFLLKSKHHYLNSCKSLFGNGTVIHRKLVNRCRKKFHTIYKN